MKKVLVLFLTAVLALSGCFHGSAKTQEKYFIFATPLSTHKIWLQAREGFETACAELGIHGDWIGPAIIDIEKMEQVIETGILQECDGIITQGVVSAELIDEASRRGIPVVLVDSDIPESSRIAFMGKDFHEQAVLFLKQTEEKLGMETPLKIAIQAASLEFEIGKEQVREIENVFASHPGGFEIVSTSQSLSEDLRAKKEWERVIAEHPEINVAINFAAESAKYCHEAAVKNRKEGSLLIFAVDDMPDTLDMIEKGQIEGSVVTSFFDYGYKGVYMLNQMLTENTLSMDSSVSLSMVTLENVESCREGNGNETQH